MAINICPICKSRRISDSVCAECGRDTETSAIAKAFLAPLGAEDIQNYEAWLAEADDIQNYESWLTESADETDALKLNFFDMGINAIRLLQALINLTELDLWGNKISDITPLRSLTNLTELSLHLNQISDKPDKFAFERKSNQQHYTSASPDKANGIVFERQSTVFVATLRAAESSS
jgi:hypothetical protein